MKPFFLLLAFFATTAFTHIHAQSEQSATSQKKSKAAKIAAISAKTTTIEARTAKGVPHSRANARSLQKSAYSENGSAAKMQYCTKTKRFVSSPYTKKTPCIKSKADCIQTGSAAKTSSAKAQSAACSPAQKAACSSANAKAKAIKVAQKKKV